MASTASQTRELGDGNESRGSHLEIRIVDDIRIDIPHQPNAYDPNGQMGRDGQRFLDSRIFIGTSFAPSQCPDRSWPWFLVYSSLMQNEAGILQVHYQELSPFEKDALKMWLFLSAMFTHYGAALYYGTCLLKGSRRSKICDQVGYISGSLASAAFLSILVPPSLVPLVFVVWMFHLPLYFDGARDRILNMVQQLYRYFSNVVVSYVRKIWNRIVGSNN